MVEGPRVSDRLTKLTAAMTEALSDVAPSSEDEWRKVRVVTVELEISTNGAVTYARGWLEKRLGSKALGLASEDTGR